MQHVLQPEWYSLKDRRNYWIEIVGRLRPGVKVAQASAALNPLFHAIREQEFTALRDQSQKERQAFVGASHLNVDAGARGSVAE
jgi:hypothetical protein